MKKHLLILSAIALFSCHKAKTDKATLSLQVTGDEITKVIKGNVYYGDQTIPVNATFQDQYSMEVIVDDQHVMPTNDLRATYVNRNVNSGSEHVIIKITVK